MVCSLLVTIDEGVLTWCSMISNAAALLQRKSYPPNSPEHLYALSHLRCRRLYSYLDYYACFLTHRFYVLLPHIDTRPPNFWRSARWSRSHQLFCSTFFSFCGWQHLTSSFSVALWLAVSLQLSCPGTFHVVNPPCRCWWSTQHPTKRHRPLILIFPKVHRKREE